MPEFSIPSARILLVSQIQGGQLPPPCPPVRYAYDSALSCIAYWEVNVREFVLTMYRVAQNKIPHQTLCNCSAISCPIFKILEAA